MRSYLSLPRRKFKGLKDEGIVLPSTKHRTEILAPLAPWSPHRYRSKLRGRGVGGVAYKARAAAPPCREVWISVAWANASSCSSGL